MNSVLIFIGFVAVLFTKKWPRGLFDFSLQIQRWTFNTYAYAFLLLRDEYPPFTGESGAYPLTLEVEYREDLSRWQIFLKWLFAIPHLLILTVLVIVAAFVVFPSRSSRSCSRVAIPAGCSTSSWEWALGGARERLCVLVHDGPLPTVQPEVKPVFCSRKPGSRRD